MHLSYTFLIVVIGAILISWAVSEWREKRAKRAAVLLRLRDTWKKAANIRILWCNSISHHVIDSDTQALIQKELGALSAYLIFKGTSTPAELAERDRLVSLISYDPPIMPRHDNRTK